MGNFRCEFQVTGDLVLPADVAELNLSSAGVATTLRNNSKNDEGHAIDMLAIVVGEADSMKFAYSELRAALAEQLDLLSFVTQSRYRIERPIRAVEWEPHQKKRQFRAYHTVDSQYPPEPRLTREYLATVEYLDGRAVPHFVRTALKYFRYGLLDPQPEDQFMRLWLSLEIVAENTKEKHKASIQCPVCGEALSCSQCGTNPERVPMAKQEIDRMIGTVAGDQAPKVSKHLFIARNGLMHGRSVESIEKECNIPMEQIVNELGTVTWHAIMSTIPLGDSGPQLHLGHRSWQFTNLTMVASLVGEMEHKGDDPHPSDGQIPSVNIELLTRFNDPEGEQGND
jgi:hypothetical protein